MKTFEYPELTKAFPKGSLRFHEIEDSELDRHAGHKKNGRIK